MNKLILLLSIMMLLSATSFAQSGTTGSLTWSIENGTLTISGNGAMPDYYYNGKDIPWYNYKGNITAVAIGDGVTSIGDNAFLHCFRLASVVIPGSTRSIGEMAFTMCGLMSVVIPNSVTTIKDGAFYACSSLTSVVIPNSVTTIGNRAFYSCYSLTSIAIPNSVTTIGSAAFFQCSSLMSVTIPSGVTSIGEQVFFQCSSLTSVTIPNSVTTIGNRAFFDCSRLTSVVIPNSVTTIGEAVFSGCSLTSVTIPNSVTTIGEYVFSKCSSLTSIIVEEGNTFYSSNNGVLFNHDKSTLIQYPEGKTGHYDIPTSVTSIGEFAFYSCRSLTSVAIPNSVTAIGDKAFSVCSGLTSVTVEWATPFLIDIWVFDGLNLTSLTLHVPAGTKALYAAANVWKNFGTITEQGTGQEIIRIEPSKMIVYANGVLSVNTPQAEQVDVYSLDGQLLCRALKVAGQATFDLRHLPRGILIVRGSSGWVKKIAKQD